jgi:hypothetical protein
MQRSALDNSLARRPAVDHNSAVPRPFLEFGAMNRFAISLLIAALPAICLGGGQPLKFEANYDEAKVPTYTLPDPLVCDDGTRVLDAKTWETKRRPEILKLYETHVYGKPPGRPSGMTFEVRSVDKNALGGKAIRKEVVVWFGSDKKGPKMEILIYLPANAGGKVPIFVGLNFGGNQAVHVDPGITLTSSWVANNAKLGITDHKANDKLRGTEASRWAIEEILAKGYGVATIYCGDIEPDKADGYSSSLRALMAAPDEWGTLAVWAWGLSRALDYFETDPDIDATRVIVMGHSRLGKTALWAGAADQRFAMVISNDSGCGGAALFRRRFGERIVRLNASFPHWFCRNFRKYDEKENDLPVDQHMLIALVAPRPVYVASAAEDLWADPKGEFLAAKHAGSVFALLGKQGLDASEQPKVNSPVMRTVGYHVRQGKHDVTPYDWQRYLEFADMHLKKKG